MDINNTVYLLLGSNLDDRQAFMEAARSEIARRIGRIMRFSGIYESEPWGFKADQPFLNQVVAVETLLGPGEVLDQIMQIEHSLGRKRDHSKRYISRVIDIDILFFNDEVILMENLVIPHPGIPERMFTLVPLGELDRNLVHPGSKKSIGELILECPDQLGVHPFQTS